MNDYKLGKTPGGDNYDKFLSKSYQAKIKEETGKLQHGKTLSGGRKFTIGVAHALEGTIKTFARIAHKLKDGEYINNELLLTQLEGSIVKLDGHLSGQLLDSENQKPRITKETSKEVKQEIEKIKSALDHLEHVTGADASKVGLTRTKLGILESHITGLENAEISRQRDIRAENPSHQAISASTQQVLSQAREKLQQIQNLRDPAKNPGNPEEGSISIALEYSEKRLTDIIKELEGAQDKFNSGVLGSSDNLLTSINKYYSDFIGTGTGTQSTLEFALKNFSPETRDRLLNQIKGENFATEIPNFEASKVHFKALHKADQALLKAVHASETKLEQANPEAFKNALLGRHEFLAAFHVQCAIDDIAHREQKPATFTEDTARSFLADRNKLLEGINAQSFTPLDLLTQADQITAESRDKKSEIGAEFAGKAREAFISNIQAKQMALLTEIRPIREEHVRQLALTEKGIQDIKEPRTLQCLKQKREVLKDIIAKLDKQTHKIQHAAATRSQTLKRSPVNIPFKDATNKELRAWEKSIGDNKEVKQYIAEKTGTQEIFEDLKNSEVREIRMSGYNLLVGLDEQINRRPRIQVYLAIKEYEQLAAKCGVNVGEITPMDKPPESEGSVTENAYFQKAKQHIAAIDQAMEKYTESLSPSDQKILDKIKSDFFQFKQLL